MRKLLVICYLTAFAFKLFAESVYTYDLAKDLIVGSVTLGLTASSLFITRSASMASRNDIGPKDSINSFDRGAMFEYNKPLDITSDISVYGLLALPLVPLAGNFKDRRAWLTYCIMYAESFFLVFGTSEVLKNSILRYRPFKYFGDVPAGKESDAYQSFPSRHTAFAFMSAGFFTSAFFAEYPQSPWKIPLSAAAYTLAAGVGAGRVFSGNHFLSDVLAGAAIGSLYGYLIPALHMKRNNHDDITLTPLSNGFLASFRF